MYLVLILFILLAGGLQETLGAPSPALNTLGKNFDFVVDDYGIYEYYLENTFNAQKSSYELGLGLKLIPIKLGKFFSTDLSFIGYTGFTSKDIFHPSVRWRFQILDFKSVYFYKQYFDARSIFTPRTEHIINLHMNPFKVKVNVRDTEFDVDLNTTLYLNKKN